MPFFRLRFLAVLIPLALHAETFIIDFNDVDDPALLSLPSVPMRDLDVGGGFARDGGVIVTSWPTNTGLVDAVPGADLVATASVTGYVPAQGPANPSFGAVMAEFEDDQGRGRLNYHDIVDFPIGTTWVAFLVRLDPDADGDGAGPVSGGVSLGNLSGYTSSVIPSTVGAFLGLTHIPAGVTGGPATVLEWSNSGLEFSTLTSSGASVVRGTTSADLGLTPGDTHLVVARLDAASGIMDAWVDPSDVTSATALGAPVLSDSLGFTTLTHLGVYGEADETGVASVEHVKAAVDNFRVSNEALGLEWVTGQVDPIFGPNPSGQYADYEFGTVFGGSDVRAVEFVCESAVGNTVTVESVTLTDDGGGAFTLGSLPPLPLVLSDQETISIPVITNGTPGSVATGAITIDTTTVSASLGSDANDLVLPIGASYGFEGVRLNPNPFMDVSLDLWGGGATSAIPGLAPGSFRGARVKGAGDPGFGQPDSLYQATVVPDGAADWELSFYFSPHDIIDFASRVDPAGTRGITGPRGDFSDRTFQLAILASEETLPNPVFADPQAANTIINLAYLPDGNSPGGVPDFYVYNGSTGTWSPTGLGAVQGSLDANNDAILDAGTGDTVNAYHMRIRGTNFGSPGASYTVTLSGGERATPVTSSNLAVFHGTNGELARPAAYAFTTGDTSSSSNAGDGTVSGFTTTFWVDDVSYFAGISPNPDLVLLGGPAAIEFPVPVTTGTAPLAIRNDGASLTLNVSPMGITGAGLSIISPIGGFTLAPGAAQDVVVQFDAAAIAPSNTTAGVLSVTSNDPGEPVATTAVTGAVTSPFQRLANGNFEAAGQDAAGDGDTFAVWNETAAGAAATLTMDVPGLNAGSATAAYLDGAAGSSAGINGIIEASLGSGMDDFEIDFYFAVLGTGRQFNMHLRADPVDTEMINIRYEAGVWSAYGAPGGGVGWVPLIDHTNGGVDPTPVLPSIDSTGNGSLDNRSDTKRVYRLHISGAGFGTPQASYSIQVYASDDVTLLGDSGPTNIFRSNNALSQPLRVIRFTTQYGANEGFWVDDVSVKDAGFEELDSDGDGIADLYESANGLDPYDPSDAASDYDGDGQTAFQESIYGTDATDPASRFTVVVENGVGTQLRITYGPLLEGNYYLLNATRDMALFSVIDEHTAGSGETGAYRVVTDPTRMRAELYKVIVNCR